MHLGAFWITSRKVSGLSQPLSKLYIKKNSRDTVAYSNIKLCRAIEGIAAIEEVIESKEKWNAFP